MLQFVVLVIYLYPGVGGAWAACGGSTGQGRGAMEPRGGSSRNMSLQTSWRANNGNYDGLIPRSHRIYHYKCSKMF